jgi:hypothetical protein
MKTMTKTTTKKSTNKVTRTTKSNTNSNYNKGIKTYVNKKGKSVYYVRDTKGNYLGKFTSITAARLARKNSK